MHAEIAELGSNRLTKFRKPVRAIDMQDLNLVGHRHLRSQHLPASRAIRLTSSWSSPS